jgi:hypothetical protein
MRVSAIVRTAVMLYAASMHSGGHAASGALTSLGQCMLRFHLPVTTYEAAAAGICGSFATLWRETCTTQASLDRSGNPKTSCDAEFDRFGVSVQQFKGRAAPTPPQTSISVHDLVAKFNAGQPVPGLPDLRGPVFVEGNAVVCQSPGALRNPNRDITLTTGACRSLNGARVRVFVHEPRTAQSYIEAYTFRSIYISGAPRSMSSADWLGGWVNLNDLRSSRSATPIARERNAAPSN